MSLIDLTRVLIKSVLVSSPTPLTIDELDRQYKQQDGENIPYAKLGYSNLRAYLFSIPDILTYDSATQTFTVTSVKGGKTEVCVQIDLNSRLNTEKLLIFAAYPETGGWPEEQ